MLARSLALRLLALVIAAAQAVVPGIASLVDARPAALAQSVERVAHVDAPGNTHGIEHPDRCALCGIATRVAAPAPPPPVVPEARDATLPPRDVIVAAVEAAERSTLRARAPPTG